MVLNTDPNKVLELIDGWTRTGDVLEQQAETYTRLVDRPGGSLWDGATADAARNRAAQDFRAITATRDTVDARAAQIRQAVASNLMPPLANAKQIITNAESHPGVTVNADLSITYTAPEGTSKETADANAKTVAAAEAELKAEANKWWAAENDVAAQIRDAESAVSKDLNFGAALYNVRRAFALKPGEVRNLGPIAGTGSGTGRIGVGAVDLGEIIVLPDGTAVAIGGDGWKGGWLGDLGVPDHYPSVGMVPSPESLGQLGPVQLSQLLGLGEGSGKELFAQYPGRGDTLPAGTIQVNGKTYVMVAGTTALKPTGGTWFVEAKPGEIGWTEIPHSYQPGNYANGGQSQISGYQGKDGKVYIAADSFDRTHGVTLYRADPDTFTDRSTWQPYVQNPSGSGSWGAPGQTGTVLSDTPFGELSFREVDGRAVLSGFNANHGPDGAVEIRVANDPTKIFDAGVPKTVVAQAGISNAPNFLPQNYGGYIVPGSTLDDMRVLVSQWYVPTGPDGLPTGPGTYNVQEFAVNANR
ncbi:DUF4185 domain-containing protein [Mycobacterium kubicae]|uniref:DUF4185 domain-containing protein n=1 Tax=Mycobacterium kubicae TaxID=120959 RepID=UPI000A1599CC|nr:DUF4185 domain-containing protein [Mycobacterium kubicae]ORV96595.1 hypothetical protein AWC13_18200 [Mycobacterium kubicae]